MNMRFFRQILFLFFSFFTVIVVAQKRPNIVIIVSDDHSFQTISAYGSKLMQTPNIDRIAKEGVVFNKAYVTNSICGPSRAVILTGKYSHKNGFKDNEHSRFDGSQNTFIKELGKVGYQTAWIGKWHLETQPQGFSFWQILPGQGSYYNPDFLMMDGTKKRVEGYVSTVVEDAAENWLDKRDSSKPFCLVIGHKNTHRTWMPDLQDLRMFNHTTFQLPSNFYDNYQNRSAAIAQDMTIDKTMRLGYDLKMFENKEAEEKDVNINRMNAMQRQQFMGYYDSIYRDFKTKNLSGNALVEWKYQRYMKDYLATAASLDRSIGRTLDYLDKQKLTENTIVIYVSDQGFYMGEHGWFDKRFMYEESFRTPMIIRYPGKIKPATVNNHLVMNLDIAPTVLHAAGVKVPFDMQGKSFLPVVTNRTAKGRNTLYYHYYEIGEHAVSPHFGIRTSRFKLIRFYNRIESWELYDLAKDKMEMNNLYGKTSFNKTIARLKKRLNELIELYDDDDAKKILAAESSQTKSSVIHNKVSNKDESKLNRGKSKYLHIDNCSIPGPVNNFLKNKKPADQHVDNSTSMQRSRILICKPGIAIPEKEMIQSYIHQHNKSNESFFYSTSMNPLERVTNSNGYTTAKKQIEFSNYDAYQWMLSADLNTSLIPKSVK